MKRIFDFRPPLSLSRTNSNPRPFPGDYPTRWYISFEFKRLQGPRTWTYQGKPSREIANYVAKLARLYAGTVQACEYDQGGSIQYLVTLTPNRLPLGTSDWNANLLRFYYPDIVEAKMFDRWTRPLHRVLLIWRKHKIMTFWFDGDPMVNCPDKLKEYKTWLAKANLKLR